MFVIAAENHTLMRNYFLFTQDKVLINRSKSRKQSMKVTSIILLTEHIQQTPMLATQAMYNRTIPALHQLHPELFPLEEFTYERFKFSYNSVQARAFGRRLPWTAMVPFADCLNHTNVQTKYDYDVDDNGMFRLFPTGDNHYPQGAEVFNSYGRRPNENLLMDYGFAILDNEWDDVRTVVLSVCTTHCTPYVELYLLKGTAVFSTPAYH